MIDLFEFFDVVSDVFLHQLIIVIFQINNIILNLYLNKKKDTRRVGIILLLLTFI